jgi:signal-transduction protein with cAMP-binding, CBS, and nucleotidyltransferase domain
MDAIKFYMDESIVSVDSQTTVLETVKLMREKKIGSVLITEKEETIGIFTETDLLRKVIAEESSPKEVLISSVMSKPLMTIDCEMTMVAGFLKMQQSNIRHLGITEKGKIIGVISIKDIANYYVNKFRPNN